MRGERRHLPPLFARHEGTLTIAAAVPRRPIPGRRAVVAPRQRLFRGPLAEPLAVREGVRAHRARHGSKSGEEDKQGSGSSAHGLRTAEAARRYWDANLAGRTFSLNTSTGKGLYSALIDFPAGNHHAWTRKAKAGETPAVFDQPVKRTGPRVFDLDRAVMMDRLLPTVQNPWKVIGQGKDDVLIQAGRLPDGGAYTATFSIKGTGRYEFVSAYPRSKEEIADLIRDYRPRPPAGLPANTLRKSEPPALWAGGAAGLPVAVPTGHTPERAGCHASEEAYPFAAGRFLSLFCDLFKALPPGARWITVHPNGKDQKGQPVLIQPASDGAFHVIGGTGSKLNYLRLTGVKDESAYREEAEARGLPHAGLPPSRDFR